MRFTSAFFSLSPFTRSAAVVLAVAAATTVWTLGGGFLADDFLYVARFETLGWSSWPALFISDWSGGAWGMRLIELRPISALSFMVDGILWDGAAWGYRLTNLAVYFASAALVMRIAKFHGASAIGMLTAGLVFVLQPAHAETALWVTGRVDLLATFFALLFWLAANTYVASGRTAWLAGAAVSLACGVFSKESALLAPVLLVSSWLGLPGETAPRAWSRRGALILAVLATACGYAICRHLAFGGDAVAGHSNWSEPAAWQRQLRYLGWIVPILPFRETLEISTVPPVKIAQAAFLLAAGVLALATVWARVRAHPRIAAIIFFGGTWYFANAAGLLTTGYFSPRHLYFATVGISVAAGILASVLLARHRTFLAVGLAMLGWIFVARISATLPWWEAGRISRELSRTVAQAIPQVGERELLIIDVPGMWKTAWLWEWSSPHFAAPLYHTPSLPTDRILERPNLYFRSDDWPVDRRPVETLRQSSAALALTIDSDGHVQVRRIQAERLAALSEELALAIAQASPPHEWARLIHQTITTTTPSDRP